MIYTTTATKTSVAPVYDRLAVQYDDRYTSEECAAENAFVASLVESLAPPIEARTVLDVGAGTGLALDLNLALVEKYRGVDPSKGMLDELLRKHPGAEVHEGVLLEAPGAYDVVLALFGVPSYMTSAELVAAFSAIAEGGVGVFMAFHDDYLPDYHQGVAPATLLESRNFLATHARTRLETVLSGKYEVWVVR